MAERRFGYRIFNRKKEEIKESRSFFPIWKTITLGICQSPSHYENVLRYSKFNLTNYSVKVLEKTLIEQVGFEVDLVSLTATDLGYVGYDRNVTLDQVCTIAINAGLRYCPAEVGPALRLQYPDQPYGEFLKIAMKPITIVTNCDSPQIFEVNRDDNAPFLDSSYCGPESFFNAGRRCIFTLPRKVVIIGTAHSRHAVA